MMGRWGGRRKQLLDYLKERRGCGKLREKAIDCTLSRTRFRSGYGPVAKSSHLHRVQNNCSLLCNDSDDYTLLESKLRWARRVLQPPSPPSSVRKVAILEKKSRGF